LLPTTPPIASNPTHSCPETEESLMTPRQGLTDSPLPSPDLTMFVDGSSILDDQGGHRAAYAVVIIDPPRVLTATCLPMGTTSQKAELRCSPLPKIKQLIYTLTLSMLSL
jgi:hypothetical protein